jgi:hypothetical protein
LSPAHRKRLLILSMLSSTSFGGFTTVSR